MLHESCSLLCAGQSSKFFLFQPFLKGLIVTAPFAALLALLLSFLYIVRYQLRNVLSFCCMICLTVVVFVVIIPASFNLKMDFYELSEERNNAINELHKDVLQTPGYFRTTEKGVYYFTAIDHNYTASGVYQPVLPMEKKVFETFKHKNLQFSAEETSADLLIKNELVMPKYLSWSISVFNELSDYFYNAYNRGWLPYLCIASIAIALFAIWGVSFLSSWPLLSVFLMILTFALVIITNYFTLCTETFAPVKTFVNEWISPDYVNLIFPLLINTLLFLIGSIGGLVAHFIRKKRYFGADL
ncbi:MAG: hypothetical protein GX297_05655 [Treponema sp.]|nr:hypothetical protein [Treponema sp.]